VKRDGLSCRIGDFFALYRSVVRFELHAVRPQIGADVGG
jgi:hypothetical protein